MTKKQALQEVGKHSWWTEELPGCIQTLIYTLTCFTQVRRMFHPKLFSVVFLAYKDTMFYEITPEDEKEKLYYFFLEKMKRL